MMPSNVFRAIVGGLIAVGLVACGGGGGDGVSVNNVAASNMRYGGTSTISISGRNLLTGVVVTIEGPCDSLSKVQTSGSDDTQLFTCDVRGVGEIRATVSTAAGVFLARLTVQVPMPQVSVATSKGEFVMQLDAEKAPLSVLNYLGYVNAGFYSGTLFHNVIPGRGVIAGGFTAGLAVKAPTRPAVALESNNGLVNLRGTVGMFRGADADSARTQWYVNTADNRDLDFVDAASPGFAVFGMVISGMDVVDSITTVQTRPDLVNNLAGVPLTEVTITSIRQLR